MPSPPALSHDILQAALHGLELQKTKLDTQIAQVQSMLGVTAKQPGRPPKQEQVAEGAVPLPSPVRRRFSAATRKKMAEAQRRRWAGIKKSK